MPVWSPNRSPERYPMLWHTALQAPPGEYMLTVVRSEHDVKKLRYRFTAFKACLRAHPDHPTTKGMQRLVTEVIAVPDGDSWLVKVRTRWNAAEFIKASWPPIGKT